MRNVPLDAHPGNPPRTSHETSPPVLMVKCKEAAAICDVSERHWLALRSRGLTPEPVLLGHSVRWRRDELVAWLAAGAPSLDRWNEMREVG